jgi:hypothetical protein
MPKRRVNNPDTLPYRDIIKRIETALDLLKAGKSLESVASIVDATESLIRKVGVHSPGFYGSNSAYKIVRRYTADQVSIGQ